MARGFGAGVLWGVVVAGAGLITLSQLAPPPASVQSVPVAAGEDAAREDAVRADEGVVAEPATAEAAEERVAAEKAAAEKAAAEKAAAEKAAAEMAAADAAAAIAERHKLATEAAAAAAVAAEPPAASSESPDSLVESEAVPAPEAPVAGDEVPSLAGLGQALTVPAAEPPPDAAEPVPLPPDGPEDSLLVPGQPAGQDEPQRLPQIAPVADPDVTPAPPATVAEPAADAVPAPVVDPVPQPVAEAEPAPVTEPEADPGASAAIRDDQPGLPASGPPDDGEPGTVPDKTVPGVRISDLPQIGVSPAPEAEMVADLPPIQRFARDFTAEGKPLFVILLHDIGAAGMARDELVKLPFPVSFVVDPLAGDAKAASAAYRAAGQEVLTLANGIPQGAEASDLEQTFATLSAILPQSVALVDQDLGGFQDQRLLATLVMAVIKGEGRGLVTYDRGLNAADQIARRERVPAATIFRRLDGDGESIPTIRRYLDRAAFKAAQEGSVVVIGDTSAATVAAILEWTVEGRAATVTLAPVTAVLGR